MLSSHPAARAGHPGLRGGGEGGRSHRGAPPRPRSTPPRRAGAYPAGAGPASSTRGAGGGNRARRPRRRCARSLPDQRREVGRTNPRNGGAPRRTCSRALTACSAGKPPGAVASSLCFGPGEQRVGCRSGSRGSPQRLRSLSPHLYLPGRGSISGGSTKGLPVPGCPA